MQTKQSEGSIDFTKSLSALMVLHAMLFRHPAADKVTLPKENFINSLRQAVCQNIVRLLSDLLTQAEKSSDPVAGFVVGSSLDVLQVILGFLESFSRKKKAAAGSEENKEMNAEDGMVEVGDED